MAGETRDYREVAIVQSATANDVIIDIRHPTEAESHPLNLPEDGVKPQVMSIPFYALHIAFAELDRNKRFLLYCDKGMMSRLHAAHLLDEGHGNVAVLEWPRARDQARSAVK